FFIGGFCFHYFVWRYAVIDDISVTQDTSDTKKIWWKFAVKEGGIVERGYERAVIRDLVSPGRETLYWSWYVPDGTQQFTTFVRYRQGIFPRWQTNFFSLSVK